MTFEITKNGVLNEEVRRLSQGSSSQLKVLVTEDREAKIKAKRAKIKVDANQDTRILNVIILVGLAILRKNASSGRKRTKLAEINMKERKKKNLIVLLLPLLMMIC